MIRLFEKADVCNGRAVLCALSTVVLLAGCGGAAPEDLSDMEASPEASSQFARTQDTSAIDATDPAFPEWRNGVTPYNLNYQYDPPAVPIMVDGVLLPPSSISRFNGQPIIFLITKESQEQGFVHVFAHPRQFRAHLEASRAEGPSASTVSAQSTSPATVWADRNYSGYALSIPVGEGESDLSRLHECCFWWNWEDKISSVRAASAGTTILYKDKYYQGPSLAFGVNGSDPNLSWVGFEDNVSSVRVIP